jgi:transmembrane sensor
MKKYTDYDINDFLQDETFINWVLDPDAPENQSWQAWMKANPDKWVTAKKAVDIIRALDFRKETVAENFYVNLKQRIDHTIASENANAPKVRSIANGWIKAAAVLAGLTITILVLYYVRKPSYTFISTPYAAIKTVWLPDSSEVVLNANSSIRFNRSRTNGKREVSVTGEAFFKVRHIEIDGKAQPFEVQAGNTVCLAPSSM